MSLFGTLRQGVKTADDLVQEIAGLDLEKQRKLGAEVHKAITKNHPVLKSPAAQQRVERLAEPVLALRTQKELRYTFVILDAPRRMPFLTWAATSMFTRGCST